MSVRLRRFSVSEPEGEEFTNFLHPRNQGSVSEQQDYDSVCDQIRVFTPLIHGSTYIFIPGTVSLNRS